MRPVFIPFFALFLTLSLLSVTSVRAQSIIDNLPAEQEEPVETPVPQPPPPVLTPESFTVTDVNADVTADTAAHARDQALMQAERNALSQLYTRAGVADNSAKMTDDAVSALVQSFDLQNERQSAKRYIGVFTIHFKPAATQKKIGKAMPDAANGATAPAAETVKPMPTGSIAHITVTVQTGSLAEWAQIKKRMNAAPPVARIDIIDLGRGSSHVDLSYAGSVADLQQALTNQGLVLRQVGGVWQMYDGSMTQL